MPWINCEDCNLTYCQSPMARTKTCKPCAYQRKIDRDRERSARMRAGEKAVSVFRTCKKCGWLVPYRMVRMGVCDICENQKAA